MWVENEKYFSLGLEGLEGGFFFLADLIGKKDVLNTRTAGLLRSPFLRSTFI